MQEENAEKETAVKKVIPLMSNVHELKCPKGQLKFQFSYREWERSNQLLYLNYHQVSHCHKH